MARCLRRWFRVDSSPRSRSCSPACRFPWRTAPSHQHLRFALWPLAVGMALGVRWMRTARRRDCDPGGAGRCWRAALVNHPVLGLNGRLGEQLDSGNAK